MIKERDLNKWIVENNVEILPDGRLILYRGMLCDEPVFYRGTFLRGSYFSVDPLIEGKRAAGKRPGRDHVGVVKIAIDSNKLAFYPGYCRCLEDVPLVVM